jgi:hypothetical protein
MMLSAAKNSFMKLQFFQMDKNGNLSNQNENIEGSNAHG